MDDAKMPGHNYRSDLICERASELGCETGAKARKVFGGASDTWSKLFAGTRVTHSTLQKYCLLLGLAIEDVLKAPTKPAADEQGGQSDLHIGEPSVLDFRPYFSPRAILNNEKNKAKREAKLGQLGQLCLCVSFVDLRLLRLDRCAKITDVSAEVTISSQTQSFQFLCWSLLSNEPNDRQIVESYVGEFHPKWASSSRDTAVTLQRSFSVFREECCFEARKGGDFDKHDEFVASVSECGWDAKGRMTLIVSWQDSDGKGQTKRRSIDLNLPMLRRGIAYWRKSTHGYCQNLVAYTRFI